MSFETGTFQDGLAGTDRPVRSSLTAPAGEWWWEGAPVVAPAPVIRCLVTCRHPQRSCPAPRPGASRSRALGEGLLARKYLPSRRSADTVTQQLAFAGKAIGGSRASSVLGKDTKSHPRTRKLEYQRSMRTGGPDGLGSNPNSTVTGPARQRAPKCAAVFSCVKGRAHRGLQRANTCGRRWTRCNRYYYFT